MSDRWDSACDLLVIGSGAGSIPAALVAREHGATAIIAEKTGYLGGSTAMSGGGIWIPCNSVMAEAGEVDSVERAAAYLDGCAGAESPGSTAARRSTFLREAPRCLDFLRRHGVRFVYTSGYADYHEGEIAGGLTCGRTLAAELFDLRRLGPWAEKIRPSGMPPFPIVGMEGARLLLKAKSLGDILVRLRVAARIARNKLGARFVGFGTALYAGLLKAALRQDVQFWLDAPLKELVVREGRVVGAILSRDGCDHAVLARRGIVLNAGGFAHNARMRRQHQPAPATTDWTIANPGDTGEVLEMAQRIGAQTAMLDASWWVPSVLLPDGTPAIIAVDMQKPHSLMVDGKGKRYVNEATSYQFIGERMYTRERDGSAVPSWLIFDAQFARDYRLAGRSLNPPPPDWLDSGMLVRESSLAGLAQACGIPAAALATTVERFNGFAREGKDKDFGRGGSRYNHVYADPRNRPGPCLGPVSTAPYHAVRVYPGDIGTSGGLVTDEHGRVLATGGAPIPGLYATGNITASVMGKSYPGAGATIAPAMTFGYVAASHIMAAPADA